MKALRVLALMHEHLVPPESLHGLPAETINNWRMEWDVSRAVESLGHDLRVLGVADEIAPIRRVIAEWQPDICFNLLTHFHDRGAYHSHVVSFLELLRVAYTGCNPRGLLLAGDKALSKKILTYHRIRVPGFMVCRRDKKVRGTRRLSFPLIVKSVSEEASVTISQASIVHDLAALRERVEFVHRTVSTDAIAEEYIAGREFTVGVMGNHRLTTYPVYELTFDRLPDGAMPIQTSRAKWNLDYQKKIGFTTGPASLPETSAAAIAATAKRIYRALSLSGFARVDLRLGEDGQIYVLEANPNPDLCRHEDFAASAKLSGVEYPQLIQRLLQLGLRYRDDK